MLLINSRKCFQDLLYLRKGKGKGHDCARKQLGKWDNRAKNGSYCQYYLGTMATDGGRHVLGIHPTLPTILIQDSISMSMIYWKGIGVRTSSNITQESIHSVFGFFLYFHKLVCLSAWELASQTVETRASPLILWYTESLQRQSIGDNTS